MEQYPSEKIGKAVAALSAFPGIGKKTALRLALYLLKQDKKVGHELARAVKDLVDYTRFCERCNNISDHELCQICSNRSREEDLICIVADIRDVMAIENTGEFKGHYHVLGGLISPMEGVGPEELNMDKLFHRMKDAEVQEVILALSATMEGDTTAFYISRKCKELNIPVSAISRGISVGGELEYADELTLSRSIMNRIPFGN